MVTKPLLTQMSLLTHPSKSGWIGQLDDSDENSRFVTEPHQAQIALTQMYQQKNTALSEV